MKDKQTKLKFKADDADKATSLKERSSEQKELSLDPIFLDNLLFIFYGEFLLKNPQCNAVLKDLLMRHKDVLVQWSI